jgi:TPR repeat protein
MHRHFSMDRFGQALLLMAFCLFLSPARSLAAPSAEDLLQQSVERQDTVLLGMYESGNYAGVLPLVTVMAEKGSVVGQYYLGHMYLNGNGVAVDTPKAVKLISNAAAAGFPRAQMTAALCMTFGAQGFPQNEALGVKYAQATASQFLDSSFVLAAAYQSGAGGLPLDKAKALSIYMSLPFEKSSYAEVVKEQIKTLEFEMYERPSTKEMLAKTPMEQTRILVDLYDKAKDYPVVLALAAPLAEKGSPVGQQYLGLLYWLGNGVAKDEARGAKLLTKAAEGGMHYAEMKAGTGHMFGVWGFPKDEVLAVKFLQAGFSYFPDAAFNLAQAHEFGMGGLPVDKAKAYSIYKTYAWPKDFSRMAEVNAKVKALDPNAPFEALFVKVMQAAKNIGVSVDSASAEGSSYFGSGTMMVNGRIHVGFSAELMVLEGQLPKLFLQFTSSDRRVHEPLRKMYLDALEKEVSYRNLREVFNYNSTMFTSW